jgi:hypothetical protein
LRGGIEPVRCVAGCAHAGMRTGVTAMPLTRAVLIAIKSSLISARSAVQDSAARAQRGGDKNLAERLRDIAERLADELDYVDRLLGSQP